MMPLSKLSKTTFAAILLITLMVASAGAWTVLSSSTGAGVRGTIKNASAIVDNAGWIELGTVGSGKDFSGSGSGAITVIDAKELKITFDLSNLESGEQDAMASGTLTIVEPGILVLGTINLKSVSAVVVTLSEGSHTIRYDVAGVAAYPTTNVNIQFLVVVTVDTPDTP